MDRGRKKMPSKSQIEAGGPVFYCKSVSKFKLSNASVLSGDEHAEREWIEFERKCYLKVKSLSTFVYSVCSPAAPNPYAQAEHEYQSVSGFTGSSRAWKADPLSCLASSSPLEMERMICMIRRQSANRQEVSQPNTVG